MIITSIVSAAARMIRRGFAARPNIIANASRTTAARTTG
jgi:hypothetical protein